MAAQDQFFQNQPENQGQGGGNQSSQPPPPSLPPLDKVGQGPQQTSGAQGLQQPQLQQSKPQTQQPPPPKRKFPAKIVAIIAAVLVLIVGGYFAYRFISPMIGGGGKVSLTWWGLWEDSSIVQPIIDEYESQNPNVEINYVKQSHQDYRERLSNALSQREGPDIFRFHNTWVPMFRGELDSVPASVASPADFATAYYPVASSDLSTGSGIVGLPLEYDGLTLFINEDIFQQNDKSAPQTWDDLRETALELTIKDEREVITQAGVALGRTENVDHWPEILALMMLQNGANLSNPTSELAQDALRFFTVFSRQDGVWDETLPPSTAAFAAGKVAMYFGPSWRAFEIQRQNPNLNFSTAFLPQLPKTEEDEPDVAYASYWVEGVSADSENKEEAWNFLSYMSQREQLQKLYQNASTLRAFGEPYPRVDMGGTLSDHPIIGAIIEQAPDAESWYLASRTFDGPTGLNSQLADYFADAVNAVNDGDDADDALNTAAQGINQVLRQYQLGR